MQKMHIANSDKAIGLYPLADIISVGYRFKRSKNFIFLSEITTAVSATAVSIGKSHYFFHISAMSIVIPSFFLYLPYSRIIWFVNSRKICETASGDTTYRIRLNTILYI